MKKYSDFNLSHASRLGIFKTVAVVLLLASILTHPTVLNAYIDDDFIIPAEPVIVEAEDQGPGTIAEPVTWQKNTIKSVGADAELKTHSKPQIMLFGVMVGIALICAVLFKKTRSVRHVSGFLSCAVIVGIYWVLIKCNGQTPTFGINVLNKGFRFVGGISLIVFLVSSFLHAWDRKRKGWAIMIGIFWPLAWVYLLYPDMQKILADKKQPYVYFFLGVLFFAYPYISMLFDYPGIFSGSYLTSNSYWWEDLISVAGIISILILLISSVQHAWINSRWAWAVLIVFFFPLLILYIAIFCGEKVVPKKEARLTDFSINGIKILHRHYSHWSFTVISFLFLFASGWINTLIFFPPFMLQIFDPPAMHLLGIKSATTIFVLSFFSLLCLGSWLLRDKEDKTRRIFLLFLWAPYKFFQGCFGYLSPNVLKGRYALSFKSISVIFIFLPVLFFLYIKTPSDPLRMMDPIFFLMNHKIHNIIEYFGLLSIWALWIRSILQSIEYGKKPWVVLNFLLFPVALVYSLCVPQKNLQ